MVRTGKQALALKSSFENLEAIARRYAELGRQGVASAQDVDTAQAAAQVARQTWLSQSAVEGYEKRNGPQVGSSGH